MNDRFKFRAWNRETKQYHYGAENTYDYMYGLPSVMKCSFGSLLEDTGEGNRYVVEQCTGLKDNNGNLIYEGDILATSNKDPQYDLWEPEDWGYTVIYWNEKNLCFAGTKWFIDGPEEESVFNAEFVEIVGNIHENPELL